MKKEVENNKLQALELETLENVSGGYFTEDSESYLNLKLSDYKKEYGSVTEVVNHLKSEYGNLELEQMGVTCEDAIEYAQNYYDLY
jgi:hypothetical protein